MIKRCLVSLFLAVLCSVTFSQPKEPFQEPFVLQLENQTPLGTIHDPGFICHFRWKVLDANGKAFSWTDQKDTFKHFLLTISRADQGKEITVVMEQMPPDMSEYKWTIPRDAEGRKYTVQISAPSNTEGLAPVDGQILILVRRDYGKDPLPENFEACLRVLMDWTGKRGYYTRFTPSEALKRAVYACQWIRKNEDPGTYQDYLLSMEKIENTSVKRLTVHCPVKGAQLKVDHLVVGFFEQFDARKQMYYLHIGLPVDPSYAYRMFVQKEKKQFLTLHTHFGTGHRVIEELHAIVDLVLVTENINSKVSSSSKPFESQWQKEHWLQLYSGKVETIVLQIQNGPDLKIVLNPAYSLQLIVKKERDTFRLYQGKKSHPFLGNEVNLVKFE